MRIVGLGLFTLSGQLRSRLRFFVVGFGLGRLNHQQVWRGLLGGSREWGCWVVAGGEG